MIPYLDSIVDVLNFACCCRSFFVSIKGKPIRDTIIHFVLENIQNVGRFFKFNPAQLLPFLSHIDGTISGSAALYMIRGTKASFIPNDIDIYVQDSALFNDLQNPLMRGIPTSAEFYVSAFHRSLRYSLETPMKKKFQYAGIGDMQIFTLNFIKTWQSKGHMKSKKIQLIISEVPVEAVIQNFDFTIVKNAITTAAGTLMVGVTDYESIRTNQLVIEDPLLMYYRSSSKAAERVIKYIDRLNIQYVAVQHKRIKYFY
jgi:hypothetical protein